MSLPQINGTTSFANVGPGGMREGAGIYMKPWNARPGSQDGGGVTVYLAAWDGSALATIDSSASATASSVKWSSDGAMFAYSLDNAIKVYNIDGTVRWAVTDDDVVKLADGPIDRFSLLWVPCPGNG